MGNTEVIEKIKEEIIKTEDQVLKYRELTQPILLKMPLAGFHAGMP